MQILSIFKNVDKGAINNEILYTRKYQNRIPCSFAYKAVCVDNKYSKKIVCTEQEMLLTNLLD